jgi:[acyl-carrier-protein] S-malonyltransferase
MIGNTLGIVFPGQGSQSLGMLADIAAQFSEVKETFAQASAALNYDLWSLTQLGPQEELDKTMHTQPALLAASYAIWRIIQARLSIQPVLLAGHSLGEYTALVCANTLSFTDAIQLVADRGRYMQEAVAPGVGAMAAIIGLDEVAVENICQQAIADVDEILTPANFNSIGQIVIAGHKDAVSRAMVLAKEAGAKLVTLIPVSVPSHCELMQPAAERLKEKLATLTLKSPEIPVLNNVEVKLYDSADSIRQGLVRQLYMPVRWVEIIQAFAKSGVTQIVECGPGKILTGLNKRIDKNLLLMNTVDVTSLESFLKLESERSA